MEQKLRNKDRRRRPTPPLSRYTFRGRRMQQRRVEDSQDYYIDRYPMRFLFLVVGVLLLSSLDAYLTLNLLQGGGVELNPFMSFLIEKNATLFMTVKFVITSVCLVFLLLHKNFLVFGRIKIVYFIYGVFSLYVLLIFYEIYLYLRHL